MAHFSRLNNDSIVDACIVISDADCPDPAPDNEASGQAFIADVLGLEGNWIQTSYNGNFRGVFGGIGHKYDSVADEFLPLPEHEFLPLPD